MSVQAAGAVEVLGGLAALAYAAWLWGEGAQGWPTGLLAAAGCGAVGTGLLAIAL